MEKISFRLDFMERDRQGSGQFGGGGRVEPSHDLYGGGFGSMRQISRPDAKVYFGIGGMTSSLFAKHSGVHGPGARAWQEKVQAVPAAARIRAPAHAAQIPA